SWYVCTDVRCKAEADAIKARGGVVIRILRPNSNSTSNQHSTETEMDSYLDYDAVIFNDGTFSDLHNKIHTYLSKLLSNNHL
ncbi:MAG: hypothetical protein ACRCTZ_23205, partial [Sarcina sp.]